MVDNWTVGRNFVLKNVGNDLRRGLLLPTVNLVLGFSYLLFELTVGTTVIRARSGQRRFLLWLLARLELVANGRTDRFLFSRVVLGFENRL